MRYRVLNLVVTGVLVCLLLPHKREYEEQERKLAGRNSYWKTDEDATFMRMDEDRGGRKSRCPNRPTTCK